MDCLNEYAEEIQNLFRNVHKSFRKYFLAQVCEHNFTMPQVMVMQELYHHPEITLKELSGQVGLAKSTVCGIVDRLEMQGAVTRERDEQDRRSVKISLSPQISEFTDTIDLLKKNYLANLLKNAEPGDVEKIVTGLSLLNNLMEKEKGSVQDV